MITGNKFIQNEPDFRSNNLLHKTGNLFTSTFNWHNVFTLRNPNKRETFNDPTPQGPLPSPLTPVPYLSPYPIAFGTVRDQDFKTLFLHTRFWSVQCVYRTHAEKTCMSWMTMCVQFESPVEYTNLWGTQNID
jgi:hypothetical protein